MPAGKVKGKNKAETKAGEEKNEVKKEAKKAKAKQAKAKKKKWDESTSPQRKWSRETLQDKLEARTLKGLTNQMHKMGIRLYKHPSKENVIHAIVTAFHLELSYPWSWQGVGVLTLENRLVMLKDGKLGAMRDFVDRIDEAIKFIQDRVEETELNCEIKFDGYTVDIEEALTIMDGTYDLAVAMYEAAIARMAKIEANADPLNDDRIWRAQWIWMGDMEGRILRLTMRAEALAGIIEVAARRDCNRRH